MKEPTTVNTAYHLNPYLNSKKSNQSTFNSLYKKKEYLQQNDEDLHTKKKVQSLQKRSQHFQKEKFKGIFQKKMHEIKNKYKTQSNSPIFNTKNKKGIQQNNNKVDNNQKNNPYLKKFNIRRLTKTQQSASLQHSHYQNKQLGEHYNKYHTIKTRQNVIGLKANSQEKQKKSSRNKSKLNKKETKQQIIEKLNNKYGQQFICSSKRISSKLKPKQFQLATLEKKRNTIQTDNFTNKSQQKSNHHKSINKQFFKNCQKSKRFQTQQSSYKARLTDLQKSPYKKYLLKVDNIHTFHHNANTNPLNQTQPNLDDAALQQKKKNYSFLTKFQLQEIQNYQIYYPGQRRIGSLRHFTDSNGNAKISVGDSIIYRYQIKNMLGQGSFGQVFKAYDHKKKQHIALKIIKNTPKFNAQAKVEIKILQNTLIHDPKNKSNIVKMKHAFVFRGHACLTFELLHINLYQFLKITGFSGMSTDLIRRISIQILQGLQFFSKFDIIHCDLKPQNILLKQQNKTGIKIIDVGSGCYQNEQIYTYIQSRFYRAPEIILGLRYTSAIDMWSFGCILCQLYLGYPIFPGQNQEEEILMFMELLGAPDHSLIDRGTRSRKFFIDYLPKIQPNSKGRIRTPGSKSLEKVMKGCEDRLFIQFILKCFKWVPQERMTPKQALLDDWILHGLPEQLKQQHRQSVIKNHFY